MHRCLVRAPMKIDVTLLQVAMSKGGMASIGMAQNRHCAPTTFSSGWKASTGVFYPMSVRVS